MQLLFCFIIVVPLPDRTGGEVFLIHLTKSRYSIYYINYNKSELKHPVIIESSEFDRWM